MNSDNRIDFDDARVYIEIRGKHINTRDIALGVSTYLIDRISTEEIRGEQTFPEPFNAQFQLDQDAFSFSNLTQSHQRVVLANSLVRYGSYRYGHLFIGLNDYYCLKELREDLESDLWHYNNQNYGRGIRDYISDTQVFLHAMLIWFEQAWAETHKDFAQQLIIERLKQ